MIDENDWVRHSSSDLAAAWVPLNIFVEDIRAFPSFFLPTEEEFVEMEVGLGEELLLMSRHIGHQGITRNSPILHSGMLSLSPPEYLYNKELMMTN